MHVSLSAFATLCGNQAVSRILHILHQQTGFFVDNQSTHRNVNDEILTFLSETFPAHSILTGFRLVHSLVFEIHKGTQVVIRFKDYAAAVTAIAAVRASFRHKWFPTEGNRSVSALTGNDINFCSIYEHVYLPFYKKIWPFPRKGHKKLSFVAVYADLLSLLVKSFEFNISVDLSEQSIISTDTNVVARVELGSSLSYENASCTYVLTSTNLQSKSFRLRVTAVLGTTYSFFT